MTQEEKVERLKELMRMAKVRGLAKTQADFAEMIGVSTRALQRAVNGELGIDKYINLASDKLSDAGFISVESDAERLRNMEKRIERLERLVLPKDITDETL